MFSTRRKEAARQENGEARAGREKDKEKQSEIPIKKIPVFFIDEAHKLQVSAHSGESRSLTSRSHRPALIRSIDAMKCLLDAMLVLTKQDRLCHVIHATSDPFYQTWLRQLNIMQHCKVRTPCCIPATAVSDVLRADHHHR